MARNRILLSSTYLSTLSLLCFVVVVILAWMAWERLNDFQQHHQTLAVESGVGVEQQVSFFISEKKRLVSLFARENLLLLEELASDPENDDIHERVGNLLSDYFPDRFAYSLTDRSGTPLFEDFDGLISELCVQDLKKFVNAGKYSQYIHPNTEGYHFDVMVHYGANGESGIFFVSFLADLLGDIVKSAQDPGHQLMLIQPKRDDLIEIIAEGPRVHWVRDDYRLSTDEKSRIMMRRAINGTEWEVLDIIHPHLSRDYKQNLMIESTIIFIVFAIIALYLVISLQRKETQRDIAEQQRQALLGVVSHEFRTPSSIIKGALDLILEGDAGEISEDVRKYLAMASKSTARLLVLVDDFLDLQKIESGKLQFKKSKISLSSVVKNALNINKPYAEKFDATYKLVEPLAEDMVFCDERRIEQVLTNILSNAAKYGANEDIIDVSLQRQSDRLRISIKDHGAGIPEDFQERVFEKFATANLISHKQIKSTGLGLSIAKAIVEQHGGNIGFHAMDGGGTDFWFELPVLKDAA